MCRQTLTTLDGTERHRRFYLAVLIRRSAQKKLAYMKLLEPHIWSVGGELSVSRAVRWEHRAEGLRRWVRSERAHRSSDHRDVFDRGIAVVRLTPRALECNDHLLGRIDEDELAEDAIRRRGTVVDAARQGRYRPPVIAVSRR